MSDALILLLLACVLVFLRHLLELMHALLELIHAYTAITTRDVTLNADMLTWNGARAPQKWVVAASCKSWT